MKIVYPPEAKLDRQLGDSLAGDIVRLKDMPNLYLVTASRQCPGHGLSSCLCPVDGVRRLVLDLFTRKLESVHQSHTVTELREYVEIHVGPITS